MVDKSKEDLEKELDDLKAKKEINKEDLNDIETLKQAIKDNFNKELELEKEKMEKELDDIRSKMKIFEETELSEKQKEKREKLMKEQAEQSERQRLLDEIESLKTSQQKDKLDKLVIESIVKEPHLKGHIEHVSTQAELDELVKREGESWKRLYSYETKGNKNTKVTNGYNTNNINKDSVLEEKKTQWEETIKKYFPKGRIER